MKIGKRIALLIVLILPLALASQTKTKEQRIELVNQYLQLVGDYGYAGQVLIANKNNIEINRPYGKANRESNIPATTSTVFGIASVSKSFTAVAILLLEQEGKLSVKDSLKQLFENCPADKAGITIHQLLTHSSGLPPGDLVNEYAAISKTDMVKKILGTPLRALPGRRYMYSNAGFNLLAAIIEQKSGMTYGQYLYKSIFQPAGMKHSFVNGEAILRGEILATPYNGAVANVASSIARFNIRTWGGGSVASSAEDLFRFKQALVNHQLINESLLSKMFSKHIAINNDGFSYYGYGCMVYRNPRNQKNIIDFVGDTESGFNCTIRISVDTDETYISTSNARHVGAETNRWFLDAHINNLWTESQHFRFPQQPVSIKQSAIKKYEGVYKYEDAKLQVEAKGNNLIVTAEGQAAISLLFNINEKDAELCAKTKQAVEVFLTSYTSNTEEGFKQIMSQGQLAGFIEERDELVKQYGKFKGYTIKGIYPDRDKGFFQCPITLYFEKGETELFTLWNLNSPDKPMIDYSAPGQKTVVAKIYAPSSEMHFVSYNFFKDNVDSELLFDLMKPGFVSGKEQGKIKFKR